MNEVLSVKKLSVSYGDSSVIKDISISSRKGQVVCILGRNGVGKTTLLKGIMGLVKTPSGSVLLEGTELSGLPTYKRASLGIGYVPQGRDIFPQLTVYENLLLGLERNKNRGSVDEEIYELFPVLKAMLKRKGGDLSGGQQQQLAIARALASRPGLLLLDEPTEGIQPSIIQEIGRVIKKLKSRESMAMVIVEQYLDFVLQVSDYFYVMDKGTVVMEGETRNADPHKIQEKIAI